jgi:hypothetical protein
MSWFRLTPFPNPLALLAIVAAGCAAIACKEDGPPSPEDLTWLRESCDGGALVHHANGRLYLTELVTAKTEFLANGNQPEFSPDGTRIAWIDGQAAKGRLRRGDPTVHVIAPAVEASGGVHWLSNREVAVILRNSGRKSWFRVSLDGSKKPMPELTALGTGGYECDVKLGTDGVWSYVADQSWKTSDGRSGKVPGTCSVSLSVDGSTVTSLHNPHKQCDLTAIREGGTDATLWWRYAGGYDNHRFASSDPRFLVAVDEHTRTMVVMTVDGENCARIGTLGHADGGMYGDWTSLPAVESSWLPRANQKSSSKWPANSEDTVFLWDSARSSNTLENRPPKDSLCRLELRGQARCGRAFELCLDGGSAAAEEPTMKLALQDLRRAGAGTLEVVISCPGTGGPTAATIVELTSALEFFQQDLELRVRMTVESDRDVYLDLGQIRPDRPDHVALVWDHYHLLAYRNGTEVDRVKLTAAVNWPHEQPTLTLGARGNGQNDWSGWLEGLALHRVACSHEEIQASFQWRRDRLASRPSPGRRDVEGTLLQKRSFPRPDLYPNVLIVFDYDVEGQRESVIHWGVLGGKSQGLVRDRRISRRYQLQLEPWTSHPEIQGFKLVGREELGTFAWFDVTSPSAIADVK